MTLIDLAAAVVVLLLPLMSLLMLLVSNCDRLAGLP